MEIREQNTLNKNLGLFDVFCIASGAMVSSGIFVLPGLAHALAGPAVVFSYFFAGLLAATGMLSVAEIITAMPKAGGDYIFYHTHHGAGRGRGGGFTLLVLSVIKGIFCFAGHECLSGANTGKRSSGSIRARCHSFRDS